ncbi:MAG: Fpg/Nei family DNA glycosylase [Labilithrix sp.]|nr:Fpg/Nei family DNA glycosylase [Labilithrix sp.]
MPEGDSIHRLAASLRPRLVGRTIRAFAANEIADAVSATLIGMRVVSVDARGKNLLVRFEDGRALHVHLRMSGRFGLERPRSGLYRPRSHQIRLEVEGAIVVGDRVPVVRVLKAGGEARAPDLASLGPDLLGAELDAAECVRRLRALGRRTIGEALLVQRALAGIGNIYKSETLFLERVHPLALVGALDDDTLSRLVRRAADLMRQNLGGGPRRTRPSLRGSPLWVYGRRGLPCLRCPDGIVETIRQGAPPGRSTYHCPRCQESPRR